MELVHRDILHLYLVFAKIIIGKPPLSNTLLGLLGQVGETDAHKDIVSQAA
jgi:hypothetical protein